MNIRRIISPARACIIAGAVALSALSTAANAQAAWEDTVLAGVGRSGNSHAMNSVRQGTANLADGSEVSFDPWYSASGQDLHFTMLTPVGENFGLLWGFGTGEAGEKYSIDPSLRLGFISNFNTGESSTLSLRASVVVGGYLKERPCTADYGAIGGVQTVNCRLASTPMRPADTLDYLLDEAPADKVEVSVTYRFNF